jgi:hypothetical protein
MKCNGSEKYSCIIIIIIIITSRSMRWAGLVARMGERRGVCRVLMGNLKERDHLENPGVDGRIILR